MDYTKFSKTNNLVNDFYSLIKEDEKLAVGFLDNLMGIFLSKKVNAHDDNILIAVIRETGENKEKLALKIIDTGLVDLGYANKDNIDAFQWAISTNKYKVAMKLFDTGLCNPILVNSKNEAAIDYILFNDEDLNYDPYLDVKVELIIKLMYYYIENDPTSNNLNSAIEYICSYKELLDKIVKKLNSRKNLNIDKDKFKSSINFDVICANPVAAEAGTMVTDINFVDNIDYNNKSKNKRISKNARSINPKPIALAFPDERESFLYNDPAAPGELIAKRLGGKKSNRKTRKNLR
jgi:hypothetical protein